MPPERKLSFLSLRFLVILFIGGMTTIFGLVFTAIFQTTMPTMLLESEHKYLARQVRLVNGLLSSARENVALLTEDTAIWEETYRFALGENPEYIASNWPGKSLLESFRLSFVIIKDKDGNNLYASFYNLRAKKTIEEPEGFSERLIPLTAGVMAEYAADPNASRQGKFGREGFAIFDGVAYDVAIMPIVQSKGEEASGALIMGYILDADYFQMLTHYDESVHFNISPNMDKTDWGNQSISLETQDTVTIHLPLISITNQPLVLTMTEPRQIYSSGQSLLDKATTMRFIVLVVFGVLLYQIIVRLLLHPVEQLSGDIHHIAEAEDTDSASLPVEKYSGSSELRTLCIAINTTLKKFRQSTISLDVLRRILNGIDAYLYVVDPADDTILFLNDKLAAHCNIQGNPVGRSCREIFGEESAGHGSFSVAGHLASKPGETLSWEGGSAATGRLYRNTDCLIEWVDGKTVHLRHSVDITDIKETEGQLVRMSSIVENSPQFIFYMSAQGSFEYANKGAQTALGYTPEEVIRGGSRLLFGSRALADEMYESIIPAILDKGKYAFTRPLLRKDGESRVFSFSAFTVEQKDPGIGAICVDVTNQHRLEKDLIAAKEQAERSSDAKSEFLSRMSHEMRTPLNAIIGMTSIANTARDLEKKQYCLDKISEASKHLLGVINDILDMSKIEANKFELSYAEFVFERMLIRVLDVVNFRIEEKRLRLSVTIDPSIPYSLVSDEQRISQVIANLLSNAVKFTPEQGTIALSATLSAEKNGLCSLIIAVADSGIGIPQEHQAKLFRSFEQADG
ncbi:MAG: PAS domain S-box protein, partial [Deltaproteobacteria bacterium]|nr:PAS domain S-box protein [Deltaproteobacteria bacterium]